MADRVKEKDNPTGFNETALAIENQRQENKQGGIGDLCGNTYDVFEVLDRFKKRKDMLRGIFTF